MFLDRFVTNDEMWAAGATFTVVAWGFAYIFMAVQVIWPGWFTAGDRAGCAADLVRAALPVLHEPDQRRLVRHHSGPSACPFMGHDRTGRRAHVRGPRRLEGGRAHDRPAAGLAGAAMFHLTEAIRIERPAAEAWAMLIDFPNVPALGVGRARGAADVARRGGRRHDPRSRGASTAAARRMSTAGSSTGRQDRSVTMEILGGPTRRAVATLRGRADRRLAPATVTYTVDGEMRRGLGWLTPVIPRVGRGLVKDEPGQPGTPARGSGSGRRRRPSRSEVSPPDRASAPPS